MCNVSFKCVCLTHEFLSGNSEERDTGKERVAAVNNDCTQRTCPGSRHPFLGVHPKESTHGRCKGKVPNIYKCCPSVISCFVT